MIVPEAAPPARRCRSGVPSACQCPQTAQHEPAVERAGDPADGNLVKPQLLSQGVVIEDQCTSDDVGVPPAYFVVECTATSAPSSSGCWRYGVAKVLSTITRAPAECAKSTIAAMSAMLSNGLVGVSIPPPWSHRG